MTSPTEPNGKRPDPNRSAFIWSVADLLRGDYRPHEYGKVILPFTVLRRLDCLLEPTKKAVLAELEKRKKTGATRSPSCSRRPASISLTPRRFT